MKKLYLLRSHISNKSLIWPIIAASLTLNLWGIRWGSPASWHPDEIINRTMAMATERSINPHHFAYGGLHYYVLGLGAVVPVYALSLLLDPPPPNDDVVARARWWKPRIVNIVVLARAISAAMSTAVVFFTYVIAQRLFNREAGYLAALLLTVSMSFVAVAHFATVDSPANFWYWLSCVCSVLAWKGGESRWYLIAGLAAGFAIGIKLDRIVVLFPLITVFFLTRQHIAVCKMSAVFGLVGLGYLLANPVIFTSFFEFADGFTRDLFYNALREGVEGSSHGQVLYSRAVAGLGLPLYLLAACAFLYGVWDFVRGRERAALLWLLATIVPYFFLFGSMGIQEWYVPFFLPALMILAARLFLDSLTALSRGRAYVKAALIVIVLYSSLYTIALDWQLSNDGRYAAAKWIDGNAFQNAIVQIGERGPSISEGKYRIMYSSRDAGAMNYALENRMRLDNNLLYSKVRSTILGIERWAHQKFGFETREKPYIAWFDNPRYREEAANSSNVMQPDYIVLTEDLDAARISNLMSQGSYYRLAARFEAGDLWGLKPSFPFVNPVVYVFEHGDIPQRSARDTLPWDSSK